MKRKLLTALLAVAILALLPATALADDIFADGNGTENDPYIIETVEQLEAFRDSVNDGNTYAGEYIELVAGETYDLSMLDEDWTPIGTYSAPFSGHFDGKGATITGLNMTKTDSGNTDIYYGLFGMVNGIPNGNYTATGQIFDAATGKLNEGPIAEEKYSAVVKNLVLENVSITTDGSWVGALAGGSYHAYFANIHVDNGSVIGTNSIGGVLGRGYGTVLNNVSTGSELTVGSGDNADGSVYNFGGIVGSLRMDNKNEENTNLCAVINSTNNATVDAYLSAGGLGGIVGMTPASQPIVIYGCTNNGDLSVKDTINVAGTTAYNKIVGGIGGQIQGNNDNVIANCTNNGNISGGTADYPVGALAGMANYYSGLIYNCTNTGDISGYSYYSAGMVGHGGEVTVVKSENSGKIATDLAAGYASTITAGVSTATYQDMAFADVEELAAALIKAAKTANTLVNTAAKMTLNNVTVADNSGTLELPQFLGELTADSKLCDEIIIGDRTLNSSDLYQNNINVTLGVPGAAVSLPADKTIAGKLTLCGDNMSLINKGTITNLTLSGKGIEAINLNAISASAVISGDDAVFYNGTAENNSTATLQRFETTAKNTVAYNYGTINRGVEGGHALQFGKPQTPGTTAVFHNYGTVIGGGKENSADYIIYAPRFDNVKVVNYADSTMQKGGHWFITYGSDDSPNTTGGFAGSKGTFIFQYAENTVKDNDSNIVNDINENNFVGRNNTDLDLRIIKIATIDNPVATVNGVPFANLASAFASAGAGEEVVLVKESVELTEAIPEGVTLVVPEGKSLSIPTDNMATVLGSTGMLRVAAGGSVALAGNQLIGSSGMANITAGNVDIQLAEYPHCRQ